MQFPPYQVPYLGNGTTIGLNAVLHVLISHGFAIGAMAMIVLSEYLAFKRSSDEWDRFGQGFLKVSIITITGVGAVTGVGIWFLTSVLAPRGIGSLLRVFFWPWFLEWIVFTLEVIVLLVYYFTWQTWRTVRCQSSKRVVKHIHLGIAYLLLGCTSAWLISGILGFMLTSDGWPWDKSLLSAMFNPTFLPQFLLRLGGAIALGALFSIAYLLGTGRKEAFRREALGVFGKVLMGALPLVALFATWYFAVVPSVFRAFAVNSAVSSRFSETPAILWAGIGASLLVLLVFSLAAVRGSTPVARALVVPAVVVSIAFVAEYEKVRERIRGPFLMPGYMYANQVLLAESPYLKKTGMLRQAYWFNRTTAQPDLDQQGAYLFAQNCSACHTVGGINDIAARVAGRPADGIYVILGHTHEMIPFMSPFSGTDEERRVLARYLSRLSRGEISRTPSSRFQVEADGPLPPARKSDE
jgi:mono/diheme cytochrome c family protein